MRAGMIGGLGKAIYLAHGYGVTTRYGHMSKVEVRPGQRVKRGDIIGRVGNTGRSTGYHLHYEVRQDGQPVNPLVYILDNGGAPL
jgi:murein DD-endopeptidase MepM/ murein hydrolase activator NlpD